MRSPPFSLPAFLSEKREGRGERGMIGGGGGERRRGGGENPNFFLSCSSFSPSLLSTGNLSPPPQRNADRSGVAVAVCGGGGVKNASQNKAPYTTATRRRAGKNSPPSLLPHSRDFLSKENMRNPFSRHGSEEIKKFFRPTVTWHAVYIRTVYHHACLYCIRSLFCTFLFVHDFAATAQGGSGNEKKPGWKRKKSNTFGLAYKESSLLSFPPFKPVTRGL